MEQDNNNQQTATQQKVCSNCGKSFPETGEFFPPNGHGGLRNLCRSCAREAQRVYNQRYRDKNMGPKPCGPLSSFTPREPISELRLRGYKGTLTYTQEIKL